MFLGYVQKNLANKAIEIFYQIDKPNDIIFVLMFKVCAQLERKEALNLIQSIQSKIPASSYSNPRLLTSLIHALMSCGDVQTAEVFFDKAPVKDVPLYGAMLKGRNDSFHSQIFLLRILLHS